jgi:serine/threonine protein kinase
MKLDPGTKLGPYEIDGDLALQPRIASPVDLTHAARSQRRQGFEREARAVAALSHPNLLSLFDIGLEQGISYAVTELLEGETLRSRLQRGALPWLKAAEIGTALAEGLAAAHSKRIIHRDLKPENIFITSGLSANSFTVLSSYVAGALHLCRGTGRP